LLVAVAPGDVVGRGRQGKVDETLRARFKDGVDNYLRLAALAREGA